MLIDPCLPLRFATGFAYYSLAMGVEEFGFNLYLLQLVFGGVDIPAKFITILSISYLGRHITEATTLLLAGGSILALIFVPSGEKLELPQNLLKEADPCRPVCLWVSQAATGREVGVPGIPVLLSLIHSVTLSRSLCSLGLRSLI